MLFQDRRRCTCFHEAGHAVLRWWLGHDADYAMVLPLAAALAAARAPDRYGRPQVVEATVYGYAIATPEIYKRHLANARANDLRLPERCAARVAMALMNCYAGPVAEARYTRKSLVACIIAGGSGDMESMDRILAAWFDDESDRSAARDEAISMTRAFVRSPKAWAAICVVARALQQRGELDGVVIASLCTAIYGDAPEHDAWALRWPPTSEEIQSGCIPPHRQAEAA